MSEYNRSGRNPFERIDMEYDRCAKDYGITCNAVLGLTGERKCFKTHKTCQDLASYDLVEDAFFVSFSSNQVASIAAGYVIPSLVNVSVSPAKLNPAGGGSLSSLGSRSTISVTLQDHRHTDRWVDPYTEERRAGTAQADGIGYEPYDLGTFWGKYRGRQSHLMNRMIRYTSGYIVDGVMVDTETQTFFITGFSGPDAQGKVTITGIDPLGLIKNDQAQAPARSQGSLLAAITDTDVSFTLNPAGIGNAKYPASGRVRIDEEMISFTRVGDVMTITRGQNFTAPAEHDAGSLVQWCLEFTAVNVSDILYTLLVTYGGVPAALIDKAAWDAEVADHASRLYTGIITEPEGVAKLVAEVTEQMGVYIWYDGRQNTIRLRAVRPAESDLVYEFSDDANTKEESFTPADDTSHLVTQVWVSFAQRNPTKNLDEITNYSAGEVSVDLSAETDEQGRGSWVRQIYSRWIPAAGAATALELANRILSRYKKPLKVVNFSIDAKDRDIDLGDFIRIRHRQIQDEIGRQAATLFQVLSRADAVTGTTISLSVQEAPAETFLETDETQIIIGADMVNVNLRDVYNSQVSATPVSGDKIRFVIRPNVVIGGYSAGIYSTGVAASQQVGRSEYRALYSGRAMSVGTRCTVQILGTRLYFPIIEKGPIYTGYMPILQRRGEVASVLTALGTNLAVGVRSAPNTAPLMCDLRTVPTVPAIRCGTWPAGVTLTLEIQPGAVVHGEGGAGAYQYAEQTQWDWSAGFYRSPGNTNSNAWPQFAAAIVNAFANKGAMGGDGGDAIDATDYPLTIVNNGEIRGGGGGGAAALSFLNHTNWNAFSGAYDTAKGFSRAGGGGRGFYGGEASADIFADLANVNNVGARGAVNAPGVPTVKIQKLGKTSGASINLVDALITPGAGGDSGSAGGEQSIAWSNGGLVTSRKTSGGLAGRAVVQSANVTWVNRGIIVGAEV